LRDNRLDFLIYRPISVPEAEAVLTKASEKMQPSSAPVVSAPVATEDDETTVISVPPDVDEPQQALHPTDDLAESNAAESNEQAEVDAAEEEFRPHAHAIGFREVCATVLMLALAFCLWKSRGTVVYLSRTPEGTYRVLRESVEAYFYKNQTGALPVGAAGSDAQQDAYFSRDAGASSSSNSNGQTPALGVVATESTLTESRVPLPKAADFPLPVPVLEHQEVAPVRVQRAAIPDSMKNSPPIAGPVVVTVNPAQMMPVSAPQVQPAVQQFSEPVAMSEDAARALLVHTVNPVYPPEALAQKLHGTVVLEAQVGRDGSIDDLKIVRGNFVLGRAAFAAVKQWKFQPYTLNGHAVATQTTITINFTYPPG
jgi:periplasmic protein TonB